MKENTTESIFSPDELLQYAIDNGMINVDEMQRDMDDVKNKKILEQHPYAISQYADGRWKTYLDTPNVPNNRKQIAKSTKEAAEQAVIEHYKKLEADESQKQLTMQQLYELWMLWRKETGTTAKTMQENKNEWILFVKDHKIAKIKVKDIRPMDMELFFLDITKGYAMTRKRVTNVKSVLNGMFKRAVSLEIIPHNPLGDADLSTLRNRYKPENPNKGNYTEEERQAILTHLSGAEDTYSLAIQLAFYLCVRIGELVVLKPEDIENNQLHIRRSIRKSQQMDDNIQFGKVEYSVEERIKGNQREGFRSVPLTQKAQEIIEKAIALNPDGEYLFMRYGKPILAETFNRHLKKVCGELNIKYRPSHQIRFTTATKLYEAGVPLNQLSTLLGHSDTRTTFHYIRQQTADEKTKMIMCGALD